MATIELPDADFSFEEIAISKAKDIISLQLHNTALSSYVKGGNNGLDLRLKLKIEELYGDTEKLILIKELLNHLTDFQIKNPSLEQGIYQLKYVLYSIAKTTANYNFDTSTFSLQETVEINTKLDSIIEALDSLKAGHEVIFNHIDELKQEFESLKTDYPLGKKRWYQRIGGIMLSFAGEKGADEVWEYLKPFLKEHLKQTPQLAENITRLIG